jgi:hypothetical protein
MFPLISAILLTSCRKEETEYIQAPEDEILVANSTIASLMKNTSTNDGSKDNILDYANCFDIKLPVQVSANGTEITINTSDDYKIVEYIFDESDYDYDTLNIIYPITIILDDFSEVTINNVSELNSYSNNCNGENEVDDDIECLDFQYPITISVFNTNNELTNILSVQSDKDLYGFINNMNSKDFATINFPISVTLSDGSQIIINDLIELNNVIDTHKNDCDEDDDYDYNDDDCIDCNVEELASILTSCTDWTIDRLERDSTNHDNYYDGYTFNFFNDGTLSVYWSGITAYGTWTTSGTAMNLHVIINVQGLDYCNNNWVLHEISKYTESKIDLRVGDSDRLRYTKNCN